MSVRSLRCAAAPPFPTVLWKEVAVHTLHPRRGDAPLPEDGVSAEPRGFSRRADSLFPRFLINYLFMSVWTRGCLLYTSGHDPIRLCSVAEPAPALALGSSLGWLRCPPATPIHGGWYFFALPYFLALSGAPGSCWVFPAVLERNPHYFLYARLWSMQLHIKKYTWQTAS